MYIPRYVGTLPYSKSSPAFLFFRERERGGYHIRIDTNQRPPSATILDQGSNLKVCIVLGGADQMLVNCITGK